MAGMAAALPVIAAGAGILQSIGAIQQGNAARASANFQAAQMNYQAGQERAAAQRTAIEQQRRAAYTESRAKAVAAAGGGDTSDPTVVNIEGDIKNQGEYNSLMALYNGDVKATGLETEAGATHYSGEQSFLAGQTKAATGILSTANTLYDRYAAGGPPRSVDTSDGLPWQRPGMPRPDYMGGGYY